MSPKVERTETAENVSSVATDKLTGNDIRAGACWNQTHEVITIYLAIFCTVYF